MSNPMTDHGAAGFCTDHGRPADRPTTVAEVMEAVYQAWHDVTQPWGGCADRERIERVVAAVGYADLLAERDALRAECRDTWRMFEAAEAQRDGARKAGAGFWPALAGQNDRDAWAFMAERDEARAVLAALRDAFGVLIDMAEMDADGFRTLLTPGDIRAVLDAFEAAAPGETVRAERCTDPKPWCPTETHGHVGGYITPWFRPDAPAGATVTREAVEAAWAAWFPGTSGPWSTDFRWRLYKALADLGLTVTDTPTEGGAR